MHIPDRIRTPFHHWAFFGGLLILMAGIPTSRFLMSLGQFVLLGNFILEGNYLRKFHRLRQDRAALLFLMIYAMHLIGLLWTSDFQFALKDLRIKLPFLSLPVILATSRMVSRSEFRYLLMAYVSAVTFGSLRSVWEVWHREVIDVREISVYISHIRFSLNICLAVFVLFHSLIRRWFSARWMVLLQLLLLAWLMVFLMILQSFTGIMVFLLGSFILLVLYGFRQKRRLPRLAMLSLGLMIPLAALVYLFQIVSPMVVVDRVDLHTLERKTALGNLYHHDTINQQTVNGHYLWLYLSEDELRDAWAIRSTLPYHGLTADGHDLRDILIRYLTSLNLRKDAAGVAALSEEDIRRIEEGVPNAYLPEYGVIRSRVLQIVWEYENYRYTRDPSGHSVLMRYEYWKAAWGIIQSNLLRGVGTGDTRDAFHAYYTRTDSLLDPEWRLRSHNQYLSVFVAFGLLGLIIFLAALFLPPLFRKPVVPFLFISYMIIALLSMVTEDTMESQAGATFVAFFYSFLLLMPATGAEPASPGNQ